MHMHLGLLNFLLSVTVPESPQDCGETFQSQLRELLAIKKTCDSAAFYDCCQVYEETIVILTRKFNPFIDQTTLPKGTH